MRVLVTGSRDWTDRKAVWLAIFSEYVDAEYDSGLFTVVHGDCPTGADLHARQFYEWQSRYVIEERHPADWDRYGKSAGPRRNQHMVDLGADVCLAFPLGESRGTRHCMEAARRAGIRVKVVDAAVQLLEREGRL